VKRGYVKAGKQKLHDANGEYNRKFEPTTAMSKSLSIKHLFN